MNFILPLERQESQKSNNKRGSKPSLKRKTQPCTSRIFEEKSQINRNSGSVGHICAAGSGWFAVLTTFGFDYIRLLYCSSICTSTSRAVAGFVFDISAVRTLWSRNETSRSILFIKACKVAGESSSFLLVPLTPRSPCSRSSAWRWCTWGRCTW